MGKTFSSLTTRAHFSVSVSNFHHHSPFFCHFLSRQQPTPPRTSTQTALGRLNRYWNIAPRLSHIILWPASVMCRIDQITSTGTKSRKHRIVCSRVTITAIPPPMRHPSVFAHTSCIHLLHTVSIPNLIIRRRYAPRLHHVPTVLVIRFPQLSRSHGIGY